MTHYLNHKGEKRKITPKTVTHIWNHKGHNMKKKREIYIQETKGNLHKRKNRKMMESVPNIVK